MKSVNSTQSNRWLRVVWVGVVTLLTVSVMILLIAILSPLSTLASDAQAGPIFSSAQGRLLSSGGPDVFGYTFKDSNEPNGPSYAWEEVSSTGTQLTGWTSTDDGYAGPIPIGFDFNYYGNNYDELYVGSNGYLSFGQGYGNIPGGSLPQTGAPDNDVALFGGDMYLYNYGSDSVVYYQTLSSPTRFVLEFVDLYYCCGQNTPHTFEVILYPNGDILAQYQSLNGTSTSYVGIENTDGTDGLGYGATLSDSLAIRYYYPVGVFLTPPAQTGFGEAATTVTYAVWLANQTEATDSFTLTVQPGNIWTTTLSLTQTGALADGESLSFTAWVEIPLSASPGDVDSVTIQATSVASPTVFSDTAVISTTATGGELAYVAIANEDYLALVDTAAHIVVGTIDLDPEGCDWPWRVAIPPDGETVWVACRNSDNLVVIDKSSNTIMTTVSGVSSPDGLGFTRDGAYAFVGSRNNSQVTVFDTTTYFQTSISTPGPPASIAVHPYLPLAYATNRSGNSISVIDTTALSVINSIDVGSSSHFAVVSRDGLRLYTTNQGDDSVSVIDTLTNQEIAHITGLGGRPHSLDINPDGDELFVNTGWNGAVQVIDTAAFSVERTITVDPTGNFDFSWGSDLTCDGQNLFATNPRDEWDSNGRQVAVIDTTTYSTAALISMPDTNGDSYPDWGARGIAICPQYVATGVFLSPPAQTNQGARGQVVAHEETLINATGATDSFGLTLGSHIWDTALSADSLGPIADGDSAAFTAYVTVPVGIDWYSTDAVVVTATSVASPTVYSDTATFTTQAYAPPEISVSPDVLTSTQYMNQVVTKPLTISNGNGVTLTFNIATGLPRNGLVAYYPFNGNANDESGNGNDGTVVGATLTTDRFENPDSAYSFNGIDTYITRPYSATSGLHPTEDPFAVSAWFKTSASSPAEQTIVGTHYAGTGYDGYACQVESNTGGRVYCWVSPNSQNSDVHSINPMNDGEWHHLVFMWKDDMVFLYIDTELQESVPAVGVASYVHQAPFRIGHIDNTDGGLDSRYYFNGSIDDVTVYNQALTEAEIQELYDWQGGGDVPWLSTEPTTSTVSTNSSQVISLTFNATSLQPDAYTTQILVQSNDPDTPLVSVPVTMTVLPTANMGWVEGTVTDAATADPLEATIIALGQPYTITTNPDTGYYKLWLDAGNYTLQVAAAGYVTETAVVDIVAQQGITQDFALVLNVPVLEVSPASLEVTHYVGDVATRMLTITNNGPTPLDFSIGTGPGVSFFAASTELYGYDVPDAWLRVVGTQDDTHAWVVNLETSAVIDENTDLDRYETWDVYPSDGTYCKVEADKPVVGYESDLDQPHTAFVPSLDLGPVGTEFIFFYHRGDSFYVFAVQNASVEVYDTSGSLVASRTMSAGEYWDLSLSNAVYHVISTGRIAMETVGVDGYTTVPSSEGNGVGRRFYFATDGSYFTGAFAVFAYQDADVDVYDLDSGSLLYSQHINQGDYWWQTDVGTRRLRLESTGKVEVWGGDAENGYNIENLGDDLSFAGGDGSREYYLHSLMDGSVIFALFDNTQVDVDGTVYHLDKDEYLHLDGCCYFRHIQSSQPILIQTLGRDSSWNNMGTYLGGVLEGGGGLPPWLTTDPVTGTVPAYSSTPVQVTFDATGMQPDTYTAQIIVQSNDPVTPSASVPTTMTVLPSADMGRVTGAVSDAWTGLPLAATVELVGVHSMTASPDYTIWAPAGTYSLTAYTSGYVTVTRSVDIPAGGLVTENLALEPAQTRLEWAPAAVTAMAVEGSGVTRTLTISNTGPLPLDTALYEINLTVALRTLSSVDLTGKRILYDRAHGEPSSNDYSTLVNDAISAGAVITENWDYPIDAAVLEGYDVLWVNCCGGTAWLFGELNAVNDWLSQGGAVLVQGENSAATSGPASIFGINYQSDSCTSGTTTNIVEHPISEGVSAVNVEWTCWRLAPSSGAEIVVFDPQDQPHVVAQEQNGGKMVVVSSEDFSDGYINNDDNRLLANNILAWLARPVYSDVPWLSETPQASTIPGHSSLPVTLGFDATTLSPGDYQATLAIEHNDPFQPSPIELPVTLTVVLPPEWELFLPLILKNSTVSAQ